MRKTVASVLAAASLTVAVAALPGCNSAWWQSFKNDPVQQIRSFQETAQIAVNSAQLAWSVVQPTLPPATAAEINEKFVTAVATFNHAMAALNSGLDAAAEAQQDKPDFKKLLADVTAAVSQIIDIVELYSGQPSTSKVAASAPSDAGAPAPEAVAKAGLDDAKAGLNVLKRYSAQ